MKIQYHVYLAMVKDQKIGYNLGVTVQVLDVVVGSRLVEVLHVPAMMIRKGVVTMWTYSGSCSRWSMMLFRFSPGSWLAEL